MNEVNNINYLRNFFWGFFLALLIMKAFIKFSFSQFFFNRYSHGNLLLLLFYLSTASTKIMTFYFTQWQFSFRISYSLFCCHHKFTGVCCVGVWLSFSHLRQTHLSNICSFSSICKAGGFNTSNKENVFVS